MENNNQLQEINPESKPILLQIIAVISIIFGILTLPYYFLAMPINVSEIVLSLAISFALLAGGFGLLNMKRWGLYLFSIVALYFIIGTIPGMWSSWKTLGAWRLAGWALIMGGGYILYGIISLIYLWSIRDRFK